MVISRTGGAALRSAALATILLGGVAGFAMSASAGECPAGKMGADLTKPVTMFGHPAPRFVVIDRFILQHSQELYGYMAVYLRLKGVVPPSSEQNEAH